MMVIAEQIAQELNVKTSQITQAIALIDEGATIPFIARYRKEATQGLDDGHLRKLEQRLQYLRELAERRQVIITNIEQQGKLTPSLKNDLNNADSKTRLEDLYLPYKPKRKTKGQLAIAAGLTPLANKISQNWQVNPEHEAKAFIKPELGFNNEQSVLDGVLAILIERFAEDANLIKKLRNHILKKGFINSQVIKSKQSLATKYKDYHHHSERINRVPSHRMLAMLRGRAEGVLSLTITFDAEADPHSNAIELIYEHFNYRLNQQSAASFLHRVIEATWRLKLKKSLESEFLTTLRAQAELEATKVFARNLTDILMAAPAGAKITLGLDPGMRTGCKVAIVDTTGKLLHHSTIFPHSPQNQWDKSARTLINLCQQYKVELIAIGNGTGSRESNKLIGEVISSLEKNKPVHIMVSEAGASVYSASQLAADEFPDIDVSIRSAISIARRLQDPLAELVKIDPKAIGVGQYQHDISQSQLSKALDDVVEDCVNAVGVDINNASAALLTRVAGLNKTIANNIIDFRHLHGRFNNRNELKKVARLGAKAFEQAAGFLRIKDGDNPLDFSGVHPETYPVVEKILQQSQSDIHQLIGNSDILTTLDISQLTDQHFGEVTVNDVIRELHKPGRDPRPEFKTARFQEGINTINDLKLGLTLEGVVSNVTNFGAFVDIGVHQDGLVHISALANTFVANPHDIVKAGDIVKVKVIELDVERKRINLTMRLDDKTMQAKQSPQQAKSVTNKADRDATKEKPQHVRPKQKTKNVRKMNNDAMGNAFADAFAKLKK